MKKSSFKRPSSHATNYLAIIINAFLFLVDFPSDTCEWVLTFVEVLAFLTILLASWNWQIKYAFRLSKNHFFK